MCVFTMPEVYAPVLLKWKAQRLRKETGNEALYHPHENIKLDPKTILTKVWLKSTVDHIFTVTDIHAASFQTIEDVVYRANGDMYW